MKPEMNDPIRIPTFAESIKVVFSTNAKFAMKIDMVNPTPARKAMPSICLKFTPSGNSVNLNFTLKKDINVIPIKFPITKQIAMLVISG